MLLELAKQGSVFSTRSRGARTLAQVRDSLAHDHVLEVDFADVRSVSYSFADEFIGEIHTAIAAGELDVDVRLLNMGEDVGRVVGKSLANRGILAPARP